MDKTIRVWLSDSHADEGGIATEGKLVIINCTKERVQKLASFFNEVSKYLDNSDTCHLHLRDFDPDWDPDQIDIEISVD